MTRTVSGGGIAAFAEFPYGFSAAFNFTEPLLRPYPPARRLIPLNSSFIFYLPDVICALCFCRERFLRARSRTDILQLFLFISSPPSLFSPCFLLPAGFCAPDSLLSLPFLPRPPSFSVSSFFPAFFSIFLILPPAFPSVFSPFASLFPFRLFSGGTPACPLSLFSPRFFFFPRRTVSRTDRLFSSPATGPPLCRGFRPPFPRSPRRLP